ncbi:MAG: cytochrome C biogenesis protein CcdA [Rhodobacteraceae bacterium PARR1]|nr:MAG: cytochrome C biogenesis protein CcdA [Rhodobacteraceae bacterium PARR1]
MRAALVLLVALAAPVAAPVFAVQPDEMLSDPALEARARALSKGLRCPVCQNENIDDSDAPIARDLRVLLRERLTAGDSDTAAVGYIVDRYGEFVLLNPPAQGSTLFLWLAGPAMLLAGGAVAYASLRARSRAAEPGVGLTAAEQARVAELTKPEA